MPEKNNNTKYQYCECPNCADFMGMGYYRHYLLRWVLGVIIILLSFWIGVKIGEFKGFLESDYGYGNHQRYMNGGSYPGMMNWTVPAPGPTSATPKSTTPTK